MAFFLVCVYSKRRKKVVCRPYALCNRSAAVGLSEEKKKAMIVLREWSEKELFLLFAFIKKGTRKTRAHSCFFLIPETPSSGVDGISILFYIFFNATLSLAASFTGNDIRATHPVFSSQKKG